MGKKRKNNENSKRNQHQQTEPPQEDVEDDGSSMNLTIFSILIVSCMVLGFCLGTRTTPNFAIAQWTWHAISRTPLRLYKTVQAIPHTFSSDEDDMFNVPFSYVHVNGRKVRDDASHPLVFAALREAIIREESGFVHPDIGLMIPAPSGALRGIGFVRDSYHACQTRCMPGISPEKKKAAENLETVDSSFPPFWNVGIDKLDTSEKVKHILDNQQSVDEHYRQEEILIKIPLGYQMTRKLALRTLRGLLPPDVHQRAPIHELDDAALLVLLLAHERGLGKKSKFHPYISTLPISPSCGYSPVMRPEVLQTIELMGLELGMDVIGWPVEVGKAADRAQMIADGLTKDYGPYIATAEGASTFSMMQWSLCQVASRATAGSDTHGALRMVPMVDMVNHDVDAGGFIELNGNEKLSNSGLIDAKESDAGAFVVRSLRHGRRRPLKKGQELLVNYNVPNYSPLDWFLSLGFVPPERAVKWEKAEPQFKKERTFTTN